MRVKSAITQERAKVGLAVDDYELDYTENVMQSRFHQGQEAERPRDMMNSTGLPRRREKHHTDLWLH